MKITTARRRLAMPEGFVARNSMWQDNCPVHGVTDHGDVIGGRCFKCQQKGLEEQGLVDVSRTRR